MPKRDKKTKRRTDDKRIEGVERIDAPPDEIARAILGKRPAARRNRTEPSRT